MSSERAVRHTSEPTLIRTPDQLQQAKRPEASAPGSTADQQRGLREAATRDAGILGQLQTERAHD